MNTILIIFLFVEFGLFQIIFVLTLQRLTKSIGSETGTKKILLSNRQISLLNFQKLFAIYWKFQTQKRRIRVQRFFDMDCHAEITAVQHFTSQNRMCFYITKKTKSKQNTFHIICELNMKCVACLWRMQLE